jgi:hypothetical protein
MQLETVSIGKEAGIYAIAEVTEPAQVLSPFYLPQQAILLG